MLLVDGREPGAPWQADLAVARPGLVADQGEERGLAYAVPTNQPDLGARGNTGVGPVEETPAPGVVGEISDMKHDGGLSNRALRPRRQVLAGRCWRVAMLRL